MTQTVENVFAFVAERWQVQFQVEPAMVWVVAGVVVVLSAVPGCWKPLRQAATIIHEMGHVLSAWLTGRRVSGIRLHADTSGLTISRGPTHGPGMLITLLSGYPAPGLLAVGLAALSTAGYAGASLTVFNLVLILALFLSRNVIGVLSCLIALAITGGIWWVNDSQITAYTVLALSVFYAITGVRGTFDLVRIHLRGAGANRAVLSQPAAASDAAKARQALRSIRIPIVVSLGFFLIISLGSAAAVVYLLT